MAHVPLSWRGRHGPAAPPCAPLHAPLTLRLGPPARDGKLAMRRWGRRTTAMPCHPSRQNPAVLIVTLKHLQATARGRATRSPACPAARSGRRGNWVHVSQAAATSAVQLSRWTVGMHRKVHQLPKRPACRRQRRSGKGRRRPRQGSGVGESSVSSPMRCHAHLASCRHNQRSEAAFAAPKAAVRPSQDFPGTLQASDQLCGCLEHLPPHCRCSPRHACHRPGPRCRSPLANSGFPVLQQVVFPHQGEERVVDPVASEQAALLFCDALTSERLAAVCVHLPAAACTMHLLTTGWHCHLLHSGRCTVCLMLW